jgi:hypothetical protein
MGWEKEVKRGYCGCAPRSGRTRARTWLYCMTRRWGLQLVLVFCQSEAIQEGDARCALDDAVRMLRQAGVPASR